MENEKFRPASFNWLIMIYPRLEESSDKIRNCEN